MEAGGKREGGREKPECICGVVGWGGGGEGNLQERGEYLQGWGVGWDYREGGLPERGASASAKSWVVRCEEEEWYRQGWWSRR